MKRETFNLNDIAEHLSDPEVAREFLEMLRWPDGKAICPHCDSEKTKRMEPKAGSKTHARRGTFKCYGCRRQFTVTVGTIFEDSHIPLHKWLLAIHLLCSSKKGMSAHQLHRMLGVTYKSAWFMAHRIRYAMSQPPLKDKLRGVVEADETYIGGKRKNTPPGRPGITSHKSPVFSVLEREGRVRSFHVKRVTSANLETLLYEHCEEDAELMTDDFSAYGKLKNTFPKHQVISHAKGEYARKTKTGCVHTNTVEGFFSLLKRGINGVYHHVGSHHLHRYLSEFDFRYNSRDVKDGERTLMAIKGAEGKRLTLREPSVSVA